MGLPHLPALPWVGNGVNANASLLRWVMDLGWWVLDMMTPAPRSPGCLWKPHAEELWWWNPSRALRMLKDAQQGCSTQLYCLVVDLQLVIWVPEVLWELCLVPLGWERFRRQSMHWSGMGGHERMEDTRPCWEGAPHVPHLPGVQVAARCGRRAPELRGGGV